MKFSPKNLSTFKYSLITILVLLIPIGYYFFYHVPGKEAYFTNRNLRLLGDMSEHIAAKIESFKSTIDRVVINKKSLIKQAITDSLKRNRSLTATATTVDSLLKIQSIQYLLKTRIHEIQTLELQQIRLKSGHSLFSSLIKKYLPEDADSEQIESHDLGNKFSMIHFDLALTENNFALLMDYIGQRTDQDIQGDYSVELLIRSRLSEIIQPLIPPGIFDNILLVEYGKEGRVIYQNARDEFFAMRLDSLTSKLNQPTTSGFDKIKWGNKYYNLYVQPVRIAVSANLPGIRHQSHLEWMLVGLVESAKFSSQCRTISHFKISVFASLVLLVLLSLPLFKLRFIGMHEEIKKVDLLLSIFALFLGAAVLTFFLLSIYADNRDFDEIDHSLKSFSSAIEKNLNSEIDSLFSQYRQIRKIIPDTLTDFRIPSILADPIYPYQNVSELPYPYFAQIAWVAGDGMQARKLSVDSKLTPLVNVKSRDYVQKIIQNQSWYKDGKPFYVQPIISITTGKNDAVLSFPDTVDQRLFAKMDERAIIQIPGKDSAEAIIAISVDFISLLNTVIPQGYGFCIIEDDGSVLFHNEINKNLQENFFTECDNNPKLRAAVFSKTDKHLYANYLGRGHRLYVKPLANIPWTLVTFADLNVIRSSELSALTIASIMFGLLVLIYLILFIVFRSINLIHDIHILWPKTELNKTYQFYIISLLTLCGFYYALMFKLNPTVNFIIAFSMPFLVYTFTSLLLHNRINLVALQRLALKYKIGLYLIILFCCTLLLVLSIHIFIFTVLSFGLGLLLATKFIAERINNGRWPEFYAHYAISATIFVLAASILPAIALYKISSDSEKEVLLKREQISLMQNVKLRNSRIKQELQDINLHPTSTEQNPAKMLLAKRLHYSHALDVYSRFLNGTRITDKKDNIDDIPAKESSSLDRLLARTRSAAKIIGYQNWELFKSTSANNAWDWKSAANDSLVLENNYGHNKQKLFIISHFRKFSYPSTTTWILGLPLIILILFIVFLFFVRRVFTLDIILPKVETEEWNKPQTIFQNTLYLGPPKSGKSGFLKSVKNFDLIDLREYSDPKLLLSDPKVKNKSRHKLYIIDHFAFHIDDDEWNDAKYKLIEQLTGRGDNIVVIISSIDPFEYFRKKSLHDETKMSAFNQWATILSSFSTVYHNVQTDDSEFKRFADQYATEKTKLINDDNAKNTIEHFKSLVLAECKPTLYLQRVGKEILTKFCIDTNFIHDDTIIGEIQQRAEPFYRSVWAFCSIEEKITLIHLAHNGFVPAKDANYVRRLMQKGLVNKRHGFQLLNSSFRQFVMDAETSTEIKEWKRNQEKSWGNIRTPLVTVLIAIALFIFVTQRSTFNTGIALISAFITSIPALMRFFSVLRMGALKQPEAG